MINGGIEAGPNAVLAFKEGYKKSDVNFGELLNHLLAGFPKSSVEVLENRLRRDVSFFSKAAFTRPCKANS